VFNAGGGSITVATNVTSGGNLLLEADDLSSAGQDLTVNPGVTLMATGALTLNAGDNLTVSAGSALHATGAVTLNGDFGNADGGVGSTVIVQGTITGTSANVNGGNDPDSFLIRPSAPGGVVINVNGGNPTTLPGDTLRIDVSGGATGADLTPGGVGAGTYTFSNAANVTFTGIESTTPLVFISPVPSPTTQPVTQVVFNFSEPVTGFTVDALTLTRDGTVIPLGFTFLGLGGGAMLTPSNGGKTWTLDLPDFFTSDNGTYVLTLTAAGSGIVSTASNAPLLDDASVTWVKQ
jgi:hypothetical protein